MRTAKSSLWRYLWAVLGKFQKTMMAVSSICIVVMIFVAVVARYIFKSDFYGSEELIQMFAFWLYFMGAAQGSREKSQISADILTCYITNKKWNISVQFVRELITVAISLLVSWWGIQFVAWSFHMLPKSTVFRLPMLIPHSAVGLGFVLMSFYHTVYLIQNFKDLVRVFRGQDVSAAQAFEGEA
ncbi:TRAP transporter small permease [Desulfobaculum bizertense]|uniref:TRAP-type C4-dicarboxylate transport system, small permease component n=1 Tax=Desulfobaculum bizertense DSM 18034 TaxID=1121442 RepID=A0A1T4X272_9BACT|nr:TRAP transporter small permease [Desulfobaculum bizertense]UIJ37192.1 TRAP transporter small permease [Desulfobaculum bizertense]SKA83175.1 TRAP-type C4-dicarboxylate transport system, small permease component [Desulfobaculum bizertense DSM 18034]